MAFDSATPVDYAYISLNESNQIRLLEISQPSIDGKLRCEIVHVDLDHAPPYLALSYVWGAPSSTHQLYIGGQRLKITDSLNHALQDIQDYYHSSYFDLLSGPLLVWADAVCIDQNNVAEKSKLIPLMTNIYRLASAVVTYIGPEDDETSSAISLIQLLQKFHYDHGSDSKLDFRAIQNSHLEDFGLPPSEHGCWAALRRLLRRPWSGRTWIVQESVVNETTIMLCGNTVIKEWNVFSQTVRLALNGKLPLDCITSDSHEELDKEYLDMGPDHIVALAQLRTFFWMEGSLNKTLYQLLRTCHSLASHDPRDKIYALLGLAKDRQRLSIIPDYSKPVANVFIETATKLLTTYPTLDLFSSVRGDKTIDLPTWVPDWSSYDSAFGVHNLLHHTQLLRDGLYQASGNVPSNIAFSPDGEKLTVTGHRIDTISTIIEDVPLSTSATDTPQKLHGYSTAVTLYNLLQTLEAMFPVNPYTQSCGIREALWRTVIANVTDRGREATADYEAQFAAYLELGRQISSRDAATEEMISMNHENAALMFDFVKAAGAVAAGRKFCITNSGFLGVVSVLTRPGDLICVLLGGCVPYILRQRVVNDFALIGDAYVHRLMKGEVFNMTPVVENFTIA